VGGTFAAVKTILESDDLNCMASTACTPEEMKSEMSGRLMIATLLSLAAVAGNPSSVMAQLQSVDQALELSRKTGRPIFALAGNKT
jgi:hypothetical protein